VSVLPSAGVFVVAVNEVSVLNWNGSLGFDDSVDLLSENRGLSSRVPLITA
jgi:hypothetical protein